MVHDVKCLSIRCTPRLADPEGHIWASGVWNLIWRHSRDDGLHITQRTAPHCSEIRRKERGPCACVSHSRDGHYGTQSTALSVLNSITAFKQTDYAYLSFIAYLEHNFISAIL